MNTPWQPTARDGEQTYVIAEIGKNFIQSEDDRDWEEYLLNAQVLITEAKRAGADAVKFQTHVREDEQLDTDITSPHFTGSDRYNWVGRNERATPPRFWEEVKAYADSENITFFSTPMSRAAAKKIAHLVPFWKVGSGDVQDFLLLNELRRTHKPIIISTGMVSKSELLEVVKYLEGTELGLLYCMSHYPCPPKDFNLATIEYMQETYPHCMVGFSDHSIGYDAALAAIRVGARIIEKHFSLSRDLWGSDHKVSMTPTEMSAMVKAIRSGEFHSTDPEPYYGSKDSELEGAVNKYRPFFKKKLVAGGDIDAGTLISEEMIFSMRPSKGQNGLESHLLEEVIGKEVAKDMKKYDPITSDSLL